MNLLKKNVLLVIDINSDLKKIFETIRQNAGMKEAVFTIACIDPAFKSRKKIHEKYEEVLLESLHSGAKVIRIHNAKADIQKIIRNHDVDEIVIGRPIFRFLDYFKTNTFITSLFAHQIVVIDSKKWKMNETPERLSENTVATANRTKEYLFALLAVLITTAICYLIKDIIGYQTVGLVFLMLTAFLSLTLGRGAIIITALLNFFIWNFFFITPILTLHIDNVHDVILLFANLAVAVTGGTLISRLRQNQLALQKNKARISLLYSLLESLNNTASIKGVVEKVRAEMLAHFEADAIVYLKEKKGENLDRKSFGNENLFSDEAFELASKVFQHQAIPRTIQFSALSHVQYFVLSGKRETFGVIGVAAQGNKNIDDEKLIFLKSFITQISSALEREINIDKAKEIQLMQESQKLFQVILNSVSHELKTPVSIIRSAVSNLMDEKTAAKPDTRRQICEELDLSAYRLNLLIENILNMSKIESGYLQLDIQQCDVSDLTGVALNMIKHEKKLSHKIQVELGDALPLLSIDINWMKQALYNIMNNALLYTPDESVICLKIQYADDKFVIQVIDNGPGVSVSDLDKLFDKFYRAQGSRSGGTGLGLSISKAIVEAHKGTIKASLEPSGGLCIGIVLPV